MCYNELSIEERPTIQVGRFRGLSQREMARMLGRSPSTISRELRRNEATDGTYSVCHAQGRMRQRRTACRPRKKLLPEGELFELVVVLLRDCFSPEQIAGKLLPRSNQSSDFHFAMKRRRSELIFVFSTLARYKIRLKIKSI